MSSRRGKGKTRHVCQQCGGVTTMWMGRCPNCGAWNSLVEERQPEARSSGARGRGSTEAPKAVPLAQVEPDGARRLRTGIGELDRVLGGGLVAGSVVLLAGNPGGVGVPVAGLGLAREGCKQVLFGLGSFH